MQSAVSPTALSSVISDIYDCALQPEKWPQTLTHITEITNAAYTTISLGHPSEGTAVMAVHSPWDPEMLRILNEVYGPEIPGIWDIVNGDLDAPFSTLANVPESEFQQSRFYREWVAPQGLRDACVAKFAGTEKRIGLVTVVTRANRDIISVQERDFIRLISPHLRRAALIGDLLDQRNIAVAAYRSTLDSLSTPVLLADADARVSHANAAADRLLSSDTRLSVVKGILTATSRVGSNALGDAIRRAATDGGAQLGGRGIGIPLSTPSESPMVAYVLPLAASEVRRSFGSAGVAVFVSSGAAHVAPTEGILITLYDLTPAEARVMTAAGRGLPMSEIGTALSISENTVKTHLGKVYSKTGMVRQAELVALMLSIAKP